MPLHSAHPSRVPLQAAGRDLTGKNMGVDGDAPRGLEDYNSSSFSFHSNRSATIGRRAHSLLTEWRKRKVAFELQKGLAWSDLRPPMIDLTGARTHICLIHTHNCCCCKTDLKHPCWQRGTSEGRVYLLP